VNIIYGCGPAVGEALVEHTRVRLISFTGSSRVGKEISTECGRQIKKCSLELGGKNGLIVMDETSDMVDVARFFMEFCMDESCGKCVPCRVGTKMMYDLLAKICNRQGTPLDLQRLEELAVFVKETSLCGLGMSAPNPLLSTLRYFRNEYLDYVNKASAAGVH